MSYRSYFMLFDITQLDSQTIIFGGLTIVSLAMVSTFGMILYRLIKFYGNHTNDVIDRNTDAWIEQSKTNQKLVDVIERWHLKMK